MERDSLLLIHFYLYGVTVIYFLLGGNYRNLLNLGFVDTMTEFGAVGVEPSFKIPPKDLISG